jgi:hypothetical protein
MNHMNPESRRISEIIGDFTPKQLRVGISVAAAFVVSVASGALWVGETIANTNAVKQETELQVEIGRLQTKYDIAISRIEDSKAEIKQWSAAYGHVNALLDESKLEVMRLSTYLGKADNCAFIHRQIEQTKQEIAGLGSFGFIKGSDEKREKERDVKEEKEHSDLENQLSQLQKQLGTCNK